MGQEDPTDSRPHANPEVFFGGALRPSGLRGNSGANFAICQAPGRSFHSTPSMFSFFLQKFAGRHHRKNVEKCRPIVAPTNEFEQSYQSLTDDQLRAKTVEFSARVQKGETLDSILPEAFAAVKNAARRLVGREVTVCDHQLKWDMVHFDVQLIGGICLHEGRIAEMATGEGKTLVATLPLYLNALTGKNAQLVTVKDYLARRDSEWMGHLYNFLGLSVGCIQQSMHSDP